MISILVWYCIWPRIYCCRA